MADYNIYIHSTESSGGGQQGSFDFGNLTTPWENQSTSEEGKEAREVAKESPNFIADAKKTMTVAKASPWLAAAYAVVKTAYSITKTVSEFSSIQTGDFRSVIAFQNYESIKNAVFHPISTTITTFKTRTLDRIESQRREMQRELLGDSEINRYTNRGF